MDRWLFVLAAEHWPSGKRLRLTFGLGLRLSKLRWRNFQTQLFDEARTVGTPTTTSLILDTQEVQLSKQKMYIRQLVQVPKSNC